MQEHGGGQMSMKGEYTPIDAASRWPLLLLLLGSGILWLVVAGILALVASIQLHTPGFLAGCPILTYGAHGRHGRDRLRLRLARERGPRARPLGRSAGWPASRCAPRTGRSPGRSSGTSAVAGALVGHRRRATRPASRSSGSRATSSSLMFFSYCGDRRLRAPRLVGPPARGLLRVALVRARPRSSSSPGSSRSRTSCSSRRPCAASCRPIVAGWYAQSAWTLWMAPAVAFGGLLRRRRR